MEYDVKAEARKQYLSYFKVWFIIAGVLLVIAIALAVVTSSKGTVERTNHLAPTQRVYDNANVLTDEEEARLTDYIAQTEAECMCDIVLVTINMPVEGSDMMEKGFRYTQWDLNMRDIADDFYDYNKFGYNKDWEGDGVLLLDNWYEGQAGSWLSTSGSVFANMGTIEIDELLDDVAYYVEDDPYLGYKAYIDYIRELMSPKKNILAFIGTIPICFITSIVVAVIFVLSKLKNKEGESTVSVNTYTDGSANFNVREDRFIRKHVATRRIPKNTSSGGSSSGSHSYGGSHRSSSGSSHGGGGRRR